jgi:hypothetical protein
VTKEREYKLYSLENNNQWGKIVTSKIKKQLKGYRIEYIPIAAQPQLRSELRARKAAAPFFGV